ncbi:hypothetical protein GCM10022198_20790 [Klugiella xanthotipulae]|uniref:Uncharacterized protein n=1 Tax=Klugiella xanthotipulae TaxID=244735 RepID=A0A543HXU1_9MICO|nr:hypothetical protein [Klugiella xanthotipulae]TQM63166.1 hypothetical protein FB466_1420 [Klugiella xanthotipulae]
MTDVTTLPVRTRPTYGVGSIAVAGLFALVYAYDVWAAWGNLIGISNVASSLGGEVVWWGWVILVASAALPVVVFLLALWLGRRRALAVRALVFCAGLAVISVTTLDILNRFQLGAFFT